MNNEIYLEPQVFLDGAVTQLPAIDFYQYALDNIPSIYTVAPNFSSILKATAQQKQYIYDIIRSFVNVFNRSNPNTNPLAPAIPQGVYLDLLAVALNAQYTALALSVSTYNAVQNTVSYLNARGRISDFQTYFENNGLGQYFNNSNVFVDPNLTLIFSLPIPNTPLNPPNPYAIFVTSMSLLKAMGVEVVVVGANVPLVQYGSLPTDVPPYQVAPGNAGYGVLLENGEVINGGFFTSL